MRLNKHRVVTEVAVTELPTSDVSVLLGYDVVIGLFKKAMEGYCPVCGFSQLPGPERKICNECLDKEQQLIFGYPNTPYKEAVIKIVQHLMPDPPVESCVGASATEAMTHLGVYTGCMGFRQSDRSGARRALISLGAWVVARLTAMLREEEETKS